MCNATPMSTIDTPPASTSARPRVEPGGEKPQKPAKVFDFDTFELGHYFSGGIDFKWWVHELALSRGINVGFQPKRSSVFHPSPSEPATKAVRSHQFIWLNLISPFRMAVCVHKNVSLTHIFPSRIDSKTLKYTYWSHRGGHSYIASFGWFPVNEIIAKADMFYKINEYVVCDSWVALWSYCVRREANETP